MCGHHMLQLYAVIGEFNDWDEKATMMTKS